MIEIKTAWEIWMDIDNSDEIDLAHKRVWIHIDDIKHYTQRILSKH